MTHRIVTSLILFCCVLLPAAQIDLLAPLPSEDACIAEMYVGDTVPVRFEADEVYKEKGTSTRIRFSPDEGLTWFNICNLEGPPDFCPVPLYEEFWGDVTIVIEDTLRRIGPDGNPLVMSSVSESAYVKLVDYSGEEELDSEEYGPFRVRPAASRQQDEERAARAQAQKEEDDEKGSGCGAGAGVALLPPLLLRLKRKRRKKERGKGRHYLKMAAGAGLLCGLTLLLSVGCRQQSPRKVDEKLRGTWTKEALTGNRIIELSFLEGNMVKIEFLKEKQSYPGTYEIADNMLRFVDYYCGTKLPGLFRYDFKGDDLVLELVEDKFCIRNKMYPGVWKRVETQPGANPEVVAQNKNTATDFSEKKDMPASDTPQSSVEKVQNE